MAMRLTAMVMSLLAMIGAAKAADLSKFSAFDAKSAIVVDHSAWGAFLKSYAKPQGPGAATLVAYGKVSPTDKAALKAYIAKVSAIRPQTLSRDEAFAYWVNLYNAETVALIVDAYPVKSIRDIKSGPISIGPWDKKVLTIDGGALSLNDVEHKILRAYFKDNRVHFAVNCASIGCPNLRADPWTAATLNADLDAAARDYVNSPRGLSVIGGKIVASSIFQWYGKDFGASDAAILAALAKYAAPELKNRLAAARKIDRFDYDWRLNAAP